MPAANWDIADFKYEFNITDRYEWQLGGSK
jgi:hypothetical protein